MLAACSNPPGCDHFRLHGDQLKFWYWWLDSENSHQVGNHRKLIPQRNESNNLLSEMYENEKVLSADILEGKDKKMSKSLIQ